MRKLRLKIVLLLVMLFFAGSYASATIYNVTNTGTADLGAGTSGTLLYCLVHANNGDVIRFNIPGGGPHVISLSSAIQVNKEVTIDGTTEPGYSGVPLIEITGIDFDCAVGLRVESTCEIKGLSMTGFTAYGLELIADNTVVTKCYLGVRPDGTARGNDYGLALFGKGCIVGGVNEGNIISGNSVAGLAAVGNSNYIQGNTIGLNASGTAALANGKGIVLQSTGHTNTIGGSIAGEGNYISGNTGIGIEINTTGNTIKGNTIGLNAAGTVSGNGSDGIFVNGSSNTIGGPGANERNVIAGNGTMGIRILGGNGSIIKGNYIGTNAAGTSACPNSTGITVSVGNNTIGGSGAGEGNLVSGNNANGITITSGGTGTVIKGNMIGTDRTGTFTISNAGIGISVSSTGNTIGGNAAAGEGNLVSGNSTIGISILSGATGNTIKGNYIGTDKNGIADLGNGQAGINVAAGTATIGGSGTGEGNLVSGNNVNGITIAGGGTGAVIRGNMIGTDRTGTFAIANTGIGISIAATGNTIGGNQTAGEGNIISGNSTIGISVLSGANGNTIKGNYIGIDKNGAADLGNGDAGINVAASSTMIGGSGIGEGNLVSGNNTNGITIASGGTSTVIKGNMIGTDRTGTFAIANTGIGISVATTGNTIGGNSIAGEGNLVSGNSTIGISILSGATGNIIKGNYIGTDKNGIADVGNGQAGINVAAGTATIGGSGTGEGNLVSGNNSNGITIVSGGNSAVIKGNMIGTDRTGTFAIANTGVGISVVATGNIIGGNSIAGEGNLVSGNGTTGISISGAATSTTIKGNYIGTDKNGIADLGNGQAGINVAASLTTIGGVGTGESNLISGNDGNGVSIASGNNNVIKANKIGTDRTGTFAIANGGAGVNLATPGCTVGGNSMIGEGNLISGNTTNGIYAGSAANNTTIKGNYIGTDVSGTADVGNGQSGIRQMASGAVIGGSGTGEGNLISGNEGAGITTESTASLTVIKGNYIGTDKSGTAALGNTGVGLLIKGAENTAGGGAAGERNIISGNTTYGITIDGPRNVIKGNYIGTDVNGSADLGNGASGIFINGASNTIGGSAVGEGNVISGNNSEGISALSTASVTVIRGNYIGTDKTGSVAIGNASNGLVISGANSIVGGNTAGDRNIISGNTVNGLSISGADAVVNGNYIGTNAAGTAALANGASGISVQSVRAAIGGSGAGEGNLISGNVSSGITCTTSGSLTVVKGNLIGTDKTGTLTIPNGGSGIDVGTAGNVIGGSAAGERNVISGNTSNGIAISATGNTVKGNYVGTDISGTRDLGNTAVGIRISSTGNTIGGSATAGEGNIVSGNNQQGIAMVSGGTGNTISGNYIGTDKTGTVAIANTLSGISAGAGPNTIGGSAAGAGNVISGNGAHGIEVTVGNANIIKGNYVGLNAAGNAAIPNTTNGIHVAGPSNTIIGGSAAGERNVISGNLGAGIALITGTGAAVKGNIIGLDATGAVSIANVSHGISVQTASNGIGGLSGEGNIISGNGANGVNVSAGAGNLIRGNYIGTDITGTQARPNVYGVYIGSSVANTQVGSVDAANVISGNSAGGVRILTTLSTLNGNIIGANADASGALPNQGAGVLLENGNNTIGGTITGQSNTIAYNTGGGVVLTGGSYSANSIRGNSIYDNQGLGIDLGNNGVTPNDALDADSGPNGLSNFPVITSVVQSGGNTTVTGIYQGSPGHTPIIDLYSNTELDASGYGEGRKHLKYFLVNANAAGIATFSSTVTGLYNIITATATNDFGSTSEFSYTGPSFVNQSPQAVRMCQNAAPQDVKGVVHVSDPQLAQIITWYTASAPTNGTLTVTGATAASGSGDITPGGIITYAPAAGYSGSDAFTIAATDGSSTVAMVVNVAVDPLPVIDVINNDGPACAGDTINFISTTSSGTGALSYAWSGPLSFTATTQSPVILSAPVAAGGTYTLVVTDAQGCVATATTTAAINELPVISAIGASAPQCEHLPLYLNTTATGGAGGYDYSWSGPNSFASRLEDPLVASSATVLEAGVYTLSVTDANGCYATGATTINVTIYPSAPIEGPVSVDFGQVIALSNPVSGGSWSTPTPWITGVNATTGAVKGVSAGVSVISYTTLQDCVVTHTVTMLSAIQACQGQTITLSDGGVPGGTWASSNGSVATVGLSTGIVTGVNPGRAVIVYRTAAAAIVTVTVTVNPLSPTNAVIAQVCQSQSITLTNNTPGGGTWYSANTGTAVISISGIVTGVAAGSVVIYFTPVAGCLTAKVITVNPVAPITGTFNVCAGQTTLLSISPAGGNWSTSSGSLANVTSAGVVTGVSAGNPRVSYIWPTGCFSTATVMVYPLSPINTISSGKVCEGATITFTNATPVAGIWTTSNTSVATISSSGVLSGVVAGAATISYTTAHGCVVTRTTTVNPSPIVTGVASICAGQTDMLSTNLTGGAWAISSGVASVSAAGMVKGVSAGNARVSYILPTGCYGYAGIRVEALSPITGGMPGMCQSGSMTLANSTPYGGAWSSSNTMAATISASGVVRGVTPGVSIISFTATASGCVATRTVTINACRIGDTTGQATTYVAVNEETALDIKIFPNPNTGSFTLKGRTDTDNGEMDIEVVNMAGQVVYRNKVQIQNGNVDASMELDGQLPAGMYVLRAIDDRAQQTFHLILQR